MPGQSPCRPVFSLLGLLPSTCFPRGTQLRVLAPRSQQAGGSATDPHTGLLDGAASPGSGRALLRGHLCSAVGVVVLPWVQQPRQLQGCYRHLLQTGACSALGLRNKSPRLVPRFPAAASALPRDTLPQPGRCCRCVSLLVSRELKARAPGLASASASSTSGCCCAPCTVLTSSPRYLQFP